MAEFIRDYSIVAHKRETSATQGVIIDYPAYILVFLIHVLARSNDFPFEVCPDEKVYADVCSPLFFILQALVDINIVGGDLGIVDDAFLRTVSIFRAIRKVEDAVDAQMTTKLHMLAEIGIFTLNELSHGGISKLQTPGQILLPSSLYRVALVKSDTTFFDENFLRRVFHALKEFTVAHGYAQKTAKTHPKHGHKGQQDVTKSNINIDGVLDLASSKPDDLSRREITNAKTAKPDIPSMKRRKCVSVSASGSVGLHECSMIIEKQQKIPSKHCGKTIEKNMLSSSDSVCSKGSLYESHVQTRKSKRAAACSLENAVTSSKHTVEPFKCPRTKRKDTCDSKFFVQALSLMQLSEPGEYSLRGVKPALTRRLAAKEKTPLNKENIFCDLLITGSQDLLECNMGFFMPQEISLDNVNFGAANVSTRGKCKETSASEVVSQKNKTESISIVPCSHGHGALKTAYSNPESSKTAIISLRINFRIITYRNLPRIEKNSILCLYVFF
ncbi:hypothetical protein VNO80_06548 [Phaseolus coccineus]|uniref:Uncharacterized protein n=1 Tax=Phaseolus coccineus TaxID=3886 RepID=A0AAN9NII9_PHACN